MMAYTQQQAEEAKQRLLQIVNNHKINYLVRDIFTEESQFWFWSASSRSHNHHHGMYGLAIHTAEVVNLMLSSLAVLPKEPNYSEFETCAVIAGIFHDVGKLYDYSLIVTEKGEQKWVPTPHKKLIYHISRSSQEFVFALRNNKRESGEFEVSEYMSEQIQHAILAHHGRKEFGSPVIPRTRLAWLLHQCDALSAHYDIPTFDKI